MAEAQQHEGLLAPRGELPQDLGPVHVLAQRDHEEIARSSCCTSSRTSVTAARCSRQYAAPAPGQRVKLENIWSSAIQFGTDWH